MPDPDGCGPRIVGDHPHRRVDEQVQSLAMVAIAHAEHDMRVGGKAQPLARGGTHLSASLGPAIPRRAVEALRADRRLRQRAADKALEPIAHRLGREHDVVDMFGNGRGLRLQPVVRKHARQLVDERDGAEARALQQRRQHARYRGVDDGDFRAVLAQLRQPLDDGGLALAVGVDPVQRRHFGEAL